MSKYYKIVCKSPFEQGHSTSYLVTDDINELHSFADEMFEEFVDLMISAFYEDEDPDWFKTHSSCKINEINHADYIRENLTEYFG